MVKHTTETNSKLLPLIGLLLPILIFLIVLPSGYFLLRISVMPVGLIKKSAADQAFLDSTMGNWFATILGVAAGIPVGLFIDRMQREEQEKLQKSLEKHRRAKTLNLIMHELSYNQKELEILISEQKANHQIFSRVGMKDVLWRALSDGGDLKWIDDVELLSTIADAYYYIHSLIVMEKEYFNPYFNIDTSIKNVYVGDKTPYAGAKIVERVIENRPITLEAVKTACKAIEADLNGRI